MALFTVILRKFVVISHKRIGKNRSFAEQRLETRKVFENGRDVYKNQIAIAKDC